MSTVSPSFRLVGSMLWLVVVACGDDDDDDDVQTADAGRDAAAGDDAGGEGEDGGGLDAGPDGGSECPRLPADPDRERWVLVSHPYDAEGGQAAAWEALRLGADGTLARPGSTFEVGRALYGTTAFTPDGAVAITVHENGTLGAVSFEDGEPAVQQAAIPGDYYAEAAVIDPAGDAVWVLDPNWRKNGGGLFRAAIACDGTVEEPSMVAPSKLAHGLVWTGRDRAVLAAADVLSSAAGDDLHLLARSGDALAHVAGSDAFGDDEAIVSALAVTADGRWALVGDNSAFSAIPNRIAAVEIDSDALRAAQTVDVDDPMAIVASPFGGVVLVASGFGDALYSIALDPDADEPLGAPEELSYSGAGPALPAGAVLVDRGANAGLVLVAENVGVRRVRFTEDGGVTDLGAFDLGDGLEQIVGAIGLQP